jgi:hypothetical protein
MEVERQSDSIPDIELAELSLNDQSALLMQTDIIAQLDFSICFKFILIVSILNFMVPLIFIDFYYGIKVIESNQYMQWELYFYCNGIINSLLTFIAIGSIASASDINKCITILLLMSSLIICSFHVIWIMLIVKSLIDAQ